MFSGTRFPAGAPWVMALAAVVCSGTTSCRKGSESPASSFNAISVPDAGTHGCNGANQTFTPPQVPTEVPLGILAIGSMSQLAGVQGEEVLYATGAGATVVELDFTGGTPPVETLLVGPGIVDALLAGVGILTAAELSGVAVVDAFNLLVVEHTSNTILLVSRTSVDTVAFFAGYPSEVPGLADGAGTQIRFSFTHPTQIVPTGEETLFVADSGNHAIRLLSIGGFVSSFTVAGTGTPGFADGDLGRAAFDTPVGISVACTGRLLVTELGAEGLGGHLLRALSIGDFTFFGLLGSVTTLAGDGTEATVEGIGAGASLAGPVSLATTSEGDVYWLDSTTGILRRHASGTGITDCPLFSDCAAALVGPGNFTLGGRFSLAVSDGDVLYVIDADAGKLLRVTP